MSIKIGTIKRSIIPKVLHIRSKAKPNYTFLILIITFTLRRKLLGGNLFKDINGTGCKASSQGKSRESKGRGRDRVWEAVGIMRRSGWIWVGYGWMRCDLIR